MAADIPPELPAADNSGRLGSPAETGLTVQNSFHHTYARQQPAPETGAAERKADAHPGRTGTLPAARPETTVPTFVGRREVTQSILDQLAAGGGAGCVLVGEPGSGKTALIHHVLRQCSNTYVVHVRGSAFSGRTAFGALTFLLSDLDPEVAAHPVLILRGLTQLIQERAKGRAVLLAVDNGEELDEFSAMALSQLVLNRTAGLLASFRDFSKAPAELMGLWREGILSRVDLEPLETAETAELLEAELRGPVSGAAVANLHRHAGGNPHLLRLACADFREAGRLRSSGPVWVLDPRRPTPAGRMAEAVLSRLDGLSETQVGLVRTVALAGSLPLAHALDTVEPAEVDILQERGFLTVDRESVPSIRVRDAVLARSVSLALDGATQSALLQGLRAQTAAAVPATGESGADQPDPAAAIVDPVRLALWRLDSGEALDPASAVAAAREANAAGHPARAVRFLTGLQDHLAIPAAVLELVQARMSQGEYGAALSAMSSYRSLEADPDPLDEIRLLLAESRVLCMAATGAVSESAHTGLLAEGAARKHDGLLAKATERTAELAAAGDISRSDAAALEREMIVARAACNSAHGRFLENAAYLGPLQAQAAGYDNGFRVLIGSWLCEALGLTNRQDEALELAQEIERLLDGPGIGRADLARSFARVLHVHLAMGALKRAGQLLDQQRSHGRTVFPGLTAELADGLLHAYAGDPEPALRCLVPAVAQLRLGGPASLVPLAASATAYCLALSGDAKGAALHLQLKTKAADGGPWSVRRGTRHFAALAEAALGSPHAVRRFLDLAAHDHRRGVYAYELLSLLSAMRLGDRENLDRLLAVSAQQQGPFARMCETYAKGTGSYDTQLLIQAGAMAEQAGHIRFGREASESALAVASGSGDRATVRFIHRSRRGTVAPQPHEGPDSTDEYLRALTFRERAIARMAAAGTSNKSIAADLNISVRTVEGHLYQVYSKLHVGSRRELGKIMAEKAGGGK
nr:LuxR family transcriptional regulator [Arthrobacter jiangjiafuii]